MTEKSNINIFKENSVAVRREQRDQIKKTLFLRYIGMELALEAETTSCRNLILLKR